MNCKLYPALIVALFLLSSCSQQAPVAFGKLHVLRNDANILKGFDKEESKFLHQVADSILTTAILTKAKSKISEYSDTYDISELQNLNTSSLKDLVAVSIIDKTFLIQLDYTGDNRASGAVLLHLIMQEVKAAFGYPHYRDISDGIEIVDQTFERIQLEQVRGYQSF